MTTFEKILHKCRERPESLRFSDIEKILLHFGFSKRAGKGSHCRFTNGKLALDFPIHNGDCKKFYKQNLLKFLLQHKFIS